MRRIWISLVTFVFLFSAFFILVCKVHAEVPGDKLIDALIAVESKGNVNAVGDKSMTNKAYGCLQIRQPCVDDYNRWFHTSYKAEDMLGNQELSVKVCKAYIDHYATEARLGHVPSDEDMARIWNGGPNGFRKESTKGYWIMVKAKLEK
jgi:hypothetical protein